MHPAEIGPFQIERELGRGKRFFSDRVDPRELALVSTKATPKGVQLHTYRYVGPLRTGAG